MALLIFLRIVMMVIMIIMMDAIPYVKLKLDGLAQEVRIQHLMFALRIVEMDMIIILILVKMEII